MKATPTIQKIYLYLLVTFLLFGFDNVSAQAPGIEWQKTYFAPIHPDTGPQTKENSGEDWFYDVKATVDLNGNPGGYIGAGYSSFVNSGTNNNCHDYIVGGGYECEEFEHYGYVKGNDRPKMALVDLKGNLKWYKSYGAGSNGKVGVNGRFYNVIQTSDKGFLAVGALAIAEGFGYNPDDLHPNGVTVSCNPNGPGAKAYMVKTDYNGNILWQFIYGYATDPLTADNYANLGYDAVETTDGYVLCGRAENPSDPIPYSRALLIKVDKATGKITAKNLVGTAGLQSWARAITIDPSNGYLYICGKEYEQQLEDIYHYYHVFVQKINPNLTPSGINYTVNTAFDDNSVAYDIALDVIHSNIIVAGVMGVDIIYAENSQGAAEGHIYILTKTFLVQQPGGNINIGTIKGYDLQMGLTTLSDGNIAVATEKQSTVFGTIHNDVCNLDFEPGTVNLWNTDFYVAKFSGISPFSLIWEKLIDYDSPPPIGGQYGNPQTQGNLKRADCAFEVVEAPDGGLVIGGNNSDNLDDDFLVKLFSDCESRTTYGPTDINQPTYTVGVSETWSSSKKVNSSIIIPANHTLYINGSSTVIEMADTRKVGRPCNIIVEPKGKLMTTTGAKITGFQSCNSLWEGIQVQGDPTLSSTITNQGSVRTFSGSTIENMREGIVADQLIYPTLLNGSGPDYSKSPLPSFAMTGGIVQGDATNFINCKRVAYFPPYPLSNLISPYNSSHFFSSTFRCNQYLPGELDDVTTLPVATSEFVRIENNYGIAFSSSVMENTIAGLDLLAAGTGIKSIDGSFIVIGSSNFNNLNYAIDAIATNSAALKTVLKVDNAVFKNCFHGAYFAGIRQPNLVLTRNTFNVPHRTNTYAYYFDGCTLYDIEENVVNDNNNTISWGGIINKSGRDNNLVYRNTFNNSDIALTAYRRNASNDGLTGLQLKCNTFYNLIPARDIWVASISNNVGRIKADQGFCNNGGQYELTGPAGNRFYNGCLANGVCHLSKDAASITFNYNYHNSNGLWNPLYKPSTINKHDCQVSSIFSFDDACPPSSVIPCPGCELAIMRSFSQSISNAQQLPQTPSVQQQISELQFQLDQHINRLARYYIDSNKIDSALTTMLIYNRTKDAISFYLQQGNTTQAGNLLSQISQADLDDSAYVSLMTIEINLITNKSSWKNMSAAQQLIVRNIAGNNSIYNREAKNILELVYRENYPEDLPSIDTSIHKEDQFTDETGLSDILLYPNPAQKSIHIDWVTKTLSIDDITIYDGMGIMLDKIQVSEGINSLDVSLSNFRDGIYIWMFKSNNKLIEVKKVIIQK